MASIKISELEEVVTLSDSDTLPIINEGDTKQVSITKLGEILATKEYVNKTISENADMGFTPEIVNALPTENIKTNTIYMIPGENSEGENIYEEWMYVNNTWEKVGSTGTSSSTTTSAIPPAYEFKIKGNLKSSYYFITNDAESKAQFIELLNKIISDENVSNYKIIMSDAYNKNLFVEFSEYYPNHTGSFTLSGLGANDNRGVCLVGTSVASDFNNANTILERYNLSIQAITDENSIITDLSSASIYYYSSNIIHTTNNTAFTPTANYHPATKKYVDDSIKSSITDALGGSY